MDVDTEKVQHWDGWTSEREYAETEGTYGPNTYGDYYRTTERRHVPIYLDPITGLAVHDVKAYETWLATLQTKPVEEPMPDEEPYW